MAISHVFRKSFFLINFVFSAVIFSSVARAAPNPEYNNYLSGLENEVQQNIKDTEKDLENLLVKLNRVEMAPKRGPQTLIPVSSGNSRAKLNNFLNAAVKMKVRHLDFLKKQKNYLSGDTQIEKTLLPLEFAEVKTGKGLFKCGVFPLQKDEASTFEKMHSFGDYINPALGKSSAKTQGVWWANTFGALVRACAPGEVVMSEFVEGRGFVVGVRHNARDITLYGNLDASSLKSLKTGVKIPEGAPLGFALERFYFETRRGSEAVDPDEIVGQESDVKTAANSQLE